LIAKAMVAATAAGAAMVFAAPAASSQPDTSATSDYDLALLNVSVSLGGNAAAVGLPDNMTWGHAVNNDVALIHVAETITMNSNVQPVAVSGDIQLVNGASAPAANSAAADERDNGVVAGVTLPVKQHVVGLLGTASGNNDNCVSG